jgi:hypothetical protein
MAKPAITKRTTKAAALTYAELDTNFQNLQDATLTVKAGTGGTNVVADLNGTITLVAGTGVTLTGDNTAKTVTITGTANITGLTNPLVADLDTDGRAIFNSNGLNVTIREGLELGTGTGGTSINGFAGTTSLQLSANATTIANGVLITTTAIFLGNKASGTGSINIDNNATIGKQLFLRNVTTTQRNALTAFNGSILYNETTHKFQGYANGVWVDLH